MIVVDVTAECALWQEMPEAELVALRAIEKTVELSKVKLHQDAEVGILLTDDRQIRMLNAKWRNVDKATNVLSFPILSSDKLHSSPLLGDIVLAFETIGRECKEEKKSFSDHFTHLVIHGFLHLIGYDHEQNLDAEAMEAVEIEVLQALNISNPYADAELVDSID